MTVTAVVAKNKGRVMKKIMSLIYGISNEADKPAGAATKNRIRTRLWQGAGEPTDEAATGVGAGDLFLDYSNDEVYRYTSASTWTLMTAED